MLPFNSPPKRDKVHHWQEVSDEVATATLNLGTELLTSLYALLRQYAILLIIRCTVYTLINLVQMH